MKTQSNLKIAIQVVTTLSLIFKKQLKIWMLPNKENSAEAPSAAGIHLLPYGHLYFSSTSCNTGAWVPFD